MDAFVTHLGTATMLLEIGSLRLLTDPVLDSKDRTHHFALGTCTTCSIATTLPAHGLGRIDAVLLSHDQHGDNLDAAGRALLPAAGVVVTTPAAAGRLGEGARGLRPFASTTLRGEDGLTVRVTATPARHGPPLSLPFVGSVTGFILEWSGQTGGVLYISGDTVYFRGIEEIARRFEIGTAFLHVGAARFSRTGPIRYTFDAKEAARAAVRLRARTVVPVHYEGWSHFSEGRRQIAEAMARDGLDDRLAWLPYGDRVRLPA